MYIAIMINKYNLKFIIFNQKWHICNASNRWHIVRTSLSTYYYIYAYYGGGGLALHAERAVSVSFAARNCSRCHLSFTQLLIPNRHDHSYSAGHIPPEPHFLLFFPFQTCVRNDGLIAQRDGWISLFILSCMWTKKNKKIHKKKKETIRSFCAWGWTSIYFFTP